MEPNMTRNSQDAIHMHEAAVAWDWRRRPFARVVVFLLSWCVFAVSYAIDFPSRRRQTGVVQRAPNVIFILDDSTSMTETGGDALDTGLTWCSNLCSNSPSNQNFVSSGAGAPYTRNALSYNPAIAYKAWASANATNTDVERLPDADYTRAYSSLQSATAGSREDLRDETQTYYVPNSSEAPSLHSDRREYFRYQILRDGNRLVRAEWGRSGATDNSLGCPSGSTYRWQNCTDVSDGRDADETGVRALEAEK